MAVLLGQPVNKAHPLNRNRDAWYPLLASVQRPGLTLAEIAGKQLQATLTGALAFPVCPNEKSVAQYAPSFTGVYATAGSTTTLNYSRSFTLALTFMFSGNSGALGMMSHGTSGFYFRLNSSKINFLKSGVADIASGSTTLTAGIWYRAMITLDDAATANGAFYLNGIPDGTFTTALTFSGSSPITLGADGGGSEICAMQLTDFSFWSRVLSPSEAMQEYVMSRMGHHGLLNRTKPGFISEPPAAGAGGVGPILRGRVLTPGRILGGSVLC